MLCFPDPPEYVGSYVLNVSELWPIGTPFGTLSIFEPVMKLPVRGMKLLVLASIIISCAKRTGADASVERRRLESARAISPE